MLAAVPMDLIITKDLEAFPLSNNKNVTRPGTRPVPIESYNNYPYKSAGRLFFETAPGRTSSCSASSVGNNLLLTAGHCVSGQGRYYSKWSFCPQFYNNECVKGRFAGIRVWTTNEWHTRSQLGRDVAFVKVEKNEQGLSIEEVAGRYHMRYNSGRNLTCVALGYPGNHNNARTMTKSAGVQSNGHTNYSPMTVKFPSTMTFGSSGGPWAVDVNDSSNNEVNGLVSYGNPNADPNNFYGPYFDNLIRELYDLASRG